MKGPESKELEELGLRYLSVAHTVRKAIDDRMVASGLSLSRAKVLQAIVEHGPLRQGSLAEVLGLAPRSITQALDGLERDGYVKRHPDPDDQRCKLVVMTTPGLSVLSTSVGAGGHVLQSIFGELDSDAVSQLEKVLTAIEDAASSVSRPRRL